jgi:hypothetical protein
MSITPVRTAGTFDSHNDLRPHEIAEMEGMGIPADALAGPVPVRSGYVVFDELGFEFEHHHRYGQEGVRAFLFLVTDGQGVARDVVAWSPSLNKLTTWLGRAWALGEEAVYRPRLSPQGELLMWRSPVGWLKARRKGLCLVRPKAAAYYLDDAGPLLAEDTAHGAQLKQLLARPAPRILIPSSPNKKVA